MHLEHRTKRFYTLHTRSVTISYLGDEDAGPIITGAERNCVQMVYLGLLPCTGHGESGTPYSTFPSLCVCSALKHRLQLFTGRARGRRWIYAALTRIRWQEREPRCRDEARRQSSLLPASNDIAMWRSGLMYSGFCRDKLEHHSFKSDIKDATSAHSWFHNVCHTILCLRLFEPFPAHILSCFYMSDSLFTGLFGFTSL